MNISLHSLHSIDMATTQDLYKIMQVAPHAEPEVIQAAWKALLAKYHPDKTGLDELAKKLGEAKEILLDPVKRKNYDKALFSLGENEEVVGSYKLVRKIKEGGFGEIYVAEHMLLGEKVCIKKNLDVSPLHTELFVKEAKSIWNLRHHALPAVRDMYQLPDGKWALVMTFIEGPTLAEIVEKYSKRGEVVDPENACWIMERVLDALRYIHYHGVVHGDVKPQNIIVQPEEHTCALVDFGLASIRPNSSSCAEGYTEYFASPESLRGGPLLPESDLYSLGLTMIYTLGGDPKGKRLPKSVSQGIREFLNDLVIVDTARRPHWENVDLVQKLREVRLKEFGRYHTAYKKI